jgi:hypothetical protein
MPLTTGGDRCNAGARRGCGQWVPCGGVPAFAGWHTFLYPRRHTQLIFLCREHRYAVADAHVITDAERIELQRRKDR